MPPTLRGAAGTSGAVPTDQFALRTFSHSSLNTFETCPHRYFRERVLRDTAPEQGEAAAWGDTVHKLIEDWLTGALPQFPPALESSRDILERVTQLSGIASIEQKMAVDSDWSAVPYRHPTAYFRGKIDLVVQQDFRVLVIDWKTGKSRYGTQRQDARYAALVMAYYPLVTTVSTRWVYLAEGKITRNEFSREQLPELRALVDSVAANVRGCADAGNWPRVPNGLCRRFCPVTDCEHNGG